VYTHKLQALQYTERRNETNGFVYHITGRTEIKC
jgi:hypothetical protein